MATSRRRAVGPSALLLALMLACAMMAAPAAARPHVRIDARSDVIFDDRQRIVALHLHWRFDDSYSVFAVEGLDADGDGRLDREELRPLAEYNVISLREHRYFTTVTADGQAVDFGPVTEFDSTFDDGLLGLSFVLPLARPLDPATSEVRFVSYDPAYSLAIDPDRGDPVRLLGAAPAGCRAELMEGSSVERLTLSETPPQSAESGGIGALYATTIILFCPPPVAEP